MDIFLKLRKWLLLAPLLVSNATAGVIYGPSGPFGDYANFPLQISLNALPAHTAVTVSFDLYILDSWDGNDIFYGPDYFGLLIDSQAFLWSFSNFDPLGNETNTQAATSTGNFNSINTWGPIDRYFDDYGGGFTVPHTASTLTVTFFGTGLQGVDDESWRVDDVTISLEAPAPVSEPALFGLLGLGLLGAAGWRRKQPA